MCEQSKKTIVFFLFDAIGHINPMLSIITELKRRGHRPIILTLRSLGSGGRLRLDGYELDYCIQESDSDESKPRDAQRITQNVSEMFRLGPKVSMQTVYSDEGIMGKYVRDFRENHAIIESKLKQLKPDLIVFDHIVGVPCITTAAPKWVRVYSGFPSVLYSSINEHYVHGLGLRLEDVTKELIEFEFNLKSNIARQLHKFFIECKLPAWPSLIDLTPTSQFLNFYFGPDELGLDKVPTLKPIPEVWFKLEHTIDEKSVKEAKFELPKSLEKCPGKLIYFSLGTLASGDIVLVNRLLEILSESPNKFIVSMGPSHEYIKLFPNMWGDRYVDQKAVLQEVDLFVTHGGHNSVIEAFYFGIPGLVVLPIFADQFDLAQRIQDCGYGIKLNPYECTSDELLSSIDKLLNDDELKKQMKGISSRMKSIKYPEIAADKLEELMSI